MEKRIEAMIGYAQQSSVCRSRYMIEYFSQPVHSDCGVCDICLKKKKAPTSRQIEDEIAEAIRKSPKGRLSFLELKKLADPQNQDIFLEHLRDMADRGIITAGDDGFYLN